MTAPVRAGLEELLGDPRDAANPLGTAAVLAADERGDLLADGERALDDYRLNAEFVPRALGGRFDRADAMVSVLRAVFRRDPSLGLGYGVTTFIAAAPVWTAGDNRQRRWLAELLLRGGKASAGFNEMAHGADFARAELRADRHSTPAGDLFVVNGRKELIGNLARADALTLFARTDQRPGSRAHSHLLVDLTTLPGDRVRRLARERTAGIRGCLLGGMEFRDCPVPADSIVGEPGDAIETVLRAFQVTRAVLPGMAVGIVDTQLRTALRFALDRQLYHRSVAEIPHARATLVDAFVDLLISDCLSTVAARALHVLPAQTSVVSASTKYLVPKLLHEANQRLSVLLGARGYLREGPEAGFQKNTRDLLAATLTHASAATCQATVIPQLPRLARVSWLRAEPAPALVFRLGAPLPELAFDQLGLSARGADSLTATLVAAFEELGSATPLGVLCGRLVAALSALAIRCGELGPRDRTMAASRVAFDLADRYAVLLAASACVGVWREHRAGGGFLGDPGDFGGFLADEAWLLAALRRLADRLDLDPGPSPAGVQERLFTELLARYDRTHSFDLEDRRLAG